MNEAEARRVFESLPMETRLALLDYASTAAEGVGWDADEVGIDRLEVIAISAVAHELMRADAKFGEFVTPEVIQQYMNEEHDRLAKLNPEWEKAIPQEVLSKAVYERITRELFPRKRS